MAEQMPSKRQREETQKSKQLEPKRQKSCTEHILSLLEAEEEEPTQELSSVDTYLQQHLSSDSVLDLPFPPTVKADDQENPGTMTNSTQDYATPTASLKGDKEQDDVIRHLLQASDDELGIPNTQPADFHNAFAFSDGLWDLEDQAANYYTLLQSQLFMSGQNY
ncbi:hypothetical protein V6N13_115861 [Hibiscus sabdariffa]|uniref:Uncharacterized protein n=1 Tax=Hibiscus sabdariffa TaxID=183260 RepID=A0ABR2CTR3_9ROSI